MHQCSGELNVPEQLICNGMGQVLFCFIISITLYGKYNLVFDKAIQHDQHGELGVVLFPTYLILSHLLKKKISIKLEI